MFNDASIRRRQLNSRRWITPSDLHDIAEPNVAEVAVPLEMMNAESSVAMMLTGRFT